MKIVRRSMLFVLLSLMALPAWGLEIEEKSLLEMADSSGTPRLEMIEAQRLQAEFQQGVEQEKYQAALISRVVYQDSDEKAIAAFIPTFGPTTRLQLGIEKPWSFGATTQLSVFTDQQTAAGSPIDRATRLGLRATLSFDLWKNFLGRLDSLKLNSTALKEKKSLLLETIEKKQFRVMLRKLYWSLVANHQKLLTTEKLLALSKEQLKEGQRRLKSSIADEEEVARYEAQVALRRSEITSLEYQKHTYFEQLKKLLPALGGEELRLAQYDIEKTVTDVLVCAELIGQNNQVPWSETPYQSFLEYLEDEATQERKISESHGGVDLKLISNLQVSGVDQGYGNAFTDFKERGQLGYDVGLELRIPLGSQGTDSRDKLSQSTSSRYNAQKTQVRLDVESLHQETLKILKFLRQAVGDQKENTLMLEKSLKQATRKFKQARVSVQEIIQDQDALQASRLREIDTQLVVIHRLMDYFGIFTKSSCPINL